MLCQVLAAAQAGRHNHKRESYGHALIIDPWGTVIARCQGTEELWLQCTAPRCVVSWTGDAAFVVGMAICFGTLDTSKHLLHEVTTAMFCLRLIAADPLATGLAIADVDTSLLASVRQRMPIASVSDMTHWKDLGSSWFHREVA